MITLLIWSKNRALQLEALLHSINEYTDNPFDTVIIYKADGKHVESYSILEEQYPEVRFVNEQDFFLDTCTEILQNKNKFICFSFRIKM